MAKFKSREGERYCDFEDRYRVMFSNQLDVRDRKRMFGFPEVGSVVGARYSDEMGVLLFLFGCQSKLVRKTYCGDETNFLFQFFWCDGTHFQAKGL